MAFSKRRLPIFSPTLFFVFLSLLIAGSRWITPLADFEDRILHGLFRPIFSLTRSAQQKLGQISDRYVALVGVAGEKEALEKEVSALRVRVSQLEAEKGQWDRLSGYLDFAERQPYRMTAARILSFDPVPGSRSLLIDKGSRDGLRQGQAVIVPEGVVGVVTRVLPSEARVLLITDSSAAVDGEVERTRARGLLHGKQVHLGLGREYWMTQMDYLGSTEEVQEQDRVLTSGLDQVFPPGLPIGRVQKVVRDPHGLFLSAEVLPEVEFTKLREVMVILGKS